MGVTTLTVEESSRSGVLVGTGEGQQEGGVGEGFKVLNDGKTLIVAQNTSTTTGYDVTFRIQKAVDGYGGLARVHEVAANKIAIFGPFPPSEYSAQGGSDNGYMTITVEDTKVELQAIRIII